MSETKLLLSDEDFSKVTAKIFATGGRIVPDKKYQTQDYEEIVDAQRPIENLLEQSKHFYILHDDWSAEPLIMRESRSKDAPTQFFIGQKCGGPYIELYYTGQRRDNDAEYIGSGFIAYHDSYWNIQAGRNVKAPSALRKYYRSLVNIIKSDRKHWSGNATVYWVSQRSDDLLRNGDLSLGLDFLS